MTSKSYLKTVLLCLLMSFNFWTNAQNCSPDTEPPSSLNCQDAVVVAEIDGTTITGNIIIFGAEDNCTAYEDMNYRLKSNPDGNGLPPDETLFFPAGETGIYKIWAYAVDESGNWGASCWRNVQILGNPNDCIDETIKPEADCKDGVIVELQLVDTNGDGEPDGGETTVLGSDFNDASFDNCTASADLQFFIENGTSGTLSNTTSLTYTQDDIGIQTISMWVVDEAGNSKYCSTDLHIEGGEWDCLGDTTPPVAVCEANIFTSLNNNGEVIIDATVIDAGSYDACAGNNINFYLSIEEPTEIPTTTTVTLTETGVYFVLLWAEDFADNNSYCWSEVYVSDSSADCIDETVLPTANCVDGIVIDVIPNTLLEILATDLNDNSSDNCTYPASLVLTLAEGTPSQMPTTSTISLNNLSDGIVDVSLWVQDEAGNVSFCETFIDINVTSSIKGAVFIDTNENCKLDNGEANAINYDLEITTLPSGTTYTISTDVLGFYSFPIDKNLGDIQAIVNVLHPNGIGTSCISSVTVPLPILDNIALINFPIQLTDDCQNMTVDVSTPLLRRCFDNSYYASYCNYSTQIVENVEITLTLTDEMTIMGSLFPYTELGNNQILFELGSMPPGECNIIPITIYLSCEAQLGETKCIEATISPNDCNGLSNYSGARLHVTGECDETAEKVRFSIENIGDMDMQNSLEYIVVEDVIMYMMTPINLPSGGSEEVEFEANGATWHIAVPQIEGVPDLSMPSATIEGCGGLNTTGLVNVFSMDDANTYESIDCQEVIGSYDPNDKRAFPTGYGEQHFIRQNEDLEYHIRFQNTGTDTAFTVRIEDQLSSLLDLSTVRPGASSHPYQMTLNETGLMTFTFNNILLADSTTNEPASHGFVKFKVAQNLDNALGSIIENTADIYFDFNEAVITNTVFHTIGENFVEIINSTQELATGINLTVAPNPMSDVATFTLQGADNEVSTVSVFNINGQLVQQFDFTNTQFNINRNDLTSGIYFYKIEQKGIALATGKLMVK